MAKNPEAPTKIEGKITCVDGREISFQILPGDGSWHQWGNTEEMLYRTVPLVEALHEAALDHLQEEVEETCSECGAAIDDDDYRAGHGMCGSCLHDAERSGWTPGEVFLNPALGPNPMEDR